MAKSRAPIDPVPRGSGIRQRQRRDGSWRVWWEPNNDQRAAGSQPVELDPDRPTWSIKQAQKLKEGKPATANTGTGSGGRTVNALIERYKGSPHFLELADATRKDYANDFKVISEKWGREAVALFDRPVVYTWYEARYAIAPTYAGKLIRAFSILFTYAETIGWRPENSNPCRNLRLATAKRRKRFASWDEYDALIAAAHELELPTMAVAIALAVFTAQRQTGIVTAKTKHFREATFDGQQIAFWRTRQSKRGQMVSVPIHDELLPQLRAQLDHAGDREFLLHDDVTGRPFPADLFRKRWDAIRKHAAKTTPSLTTPDNQLQFRDLRRTFSVWARGAGAMREDVTDILGNSADVDAGLEEVYMPTQIDTALRAVTAIRRPDPEKKKA